MKNCDTLTVYLSDDAVSIRMAFCVIASKHQQVALQYLQDMILKAEGHHNKIGTPEGKYRPENFKEVMDKAEDEWFFDALVVLFKEFCPETKIIIKEQRSLWSRIKKFLF